MKILIDADGCPVVGSTVRAAKKNRIDCFILCDTSHVFEKVGTTTMAFSNGADSVDYAPVNYGRRYCHYSGLWAGRNVFVQEGHRY